MTSSTTARGRDFHLLWAGEGVSILGATTGTILVPLLAVLHLHAGPGWMGALTAATWLPWLVVGLPAGAWVDGWPVRRVMIAADLVSAASTASIPLAWWLGRLTLPHLLVAALVTGTAAVFFRTAYVKLIPAVVPDEQLDSANSRLFGTEAASMVVGPGVAGRLSSVLGPALGLVVTVGGFIVSALCLTAIRAGRVEQPDEEEREGLLARVAAGVRYVVHDPYLRWLAVIGALSNLGLTGYGALLVLYLVGLGLDDGGVGTYFMIAALGGVVGSAVGARLARRIGTGRASTVLLLGAPAAFLVGLPTQRGQLWLSLLGYILVGTMVVAGNVVRGSWRQRYVPREMLGRALTATSTVNYGTMPLAGVLAGWLGSTVGVRTTILLMAGVHVIACWLVLLSPLARLRALPLPEPQVAAAARPD
ncbi:MFS transporter [Arsenicicoccus sp. oral taxon 190]|uniref:MFS transporter n=1 Tax=Arsenicicoccus sp. oral taxon 190 TaxID=1658671 RepID=UPI00067A4103|nr:MFS transporter [Arsenicicoccus sp. oral taxon 190]AKT51828.1 hypothetical protein ADJ73_12070 [Arsenicicoccus sp. oral taxon 190]